MARQALFVRPLLAAPKRENWEVSTDSQLVVLGDLSYEPAFLRVVVMITGVNRSYRYIVEGRMRCTNDLWGSLQTTIRP